MKRHDEKEMQELYPQLLESGQGKTLFATKRDIVPTTFYYWVKKFQVWQLFPSPSGRNGGVGLLTVQQETKARTLRRCQFWGASHHLKHFQPL